MRRRGWTYIGTGKAVRVGQRGYPGACGWHCLACVPAAIRGAEDDSITWLA